MPRPLLGLLAGTPLVLALLFAPRSVAAAEPAPEAPTSAASVDPGDPPGATRFEPTRHDAAPTPAREVRTLHAALREALVALRAELAAAAPEQRAAIQRRIEAEKLGFELRLANVQLVRARRAGRADDAERLGRRIAQLTPAMARLGVTPEGGAR